MAAKPIFRPSWTDPLRQALNQNPERVAVMGIGSPLRGDDAVGTLVAQRLRELVSSDDLLIIVGGSAPENCIGLLRRFCPDWLLVIDAAVMGLPSGSIAWLPWEQTAGLSASTHTLPIHILLDFVRAELGCEAALIGVEPRNLAFDAPLSSEVQQALDHLIEVLIVELKPNLHPG